MVERLFRAGAWELDRSWITAYWAMPSWVFDQCSVSTSKSAHERAGPRVCVRHQAVAPLASSCLVRPALPHGSIPAQLMSARAPVQIAIDVWNVCSARPGDGRRMPSVFPVPAEDQTGNLIGRKSVSGVSEIRFQSRHFQWINLGVGNPITGSQDLQADHPQARPGDGS